MVSFLCRRNASVSHLNGLHVTVLQLSKEKKTEIALNFKSVSPKISRIAQQKRKNDFFFLFCQKNPFGYLFSEMTSKGSISFTLLRNLQNLKFDNRAYSGGHET